jgi:Reverse transcriptase (RNA-dependent DNA polymerase)
VALDTFAGLPARCVHLNVNGLQSNAVKRRTLFAALEERHIHVAVISETHCATDAQGLQWVQAGAGPGQPWQGTAFFSHGTSASCGVAVLVHRSVPMVGQPKVVWQDTDGRLLRVEWTRPGSSVPVAIVAVYAPCVQNQRLTFLRQTGPLAAALAAGSGAAAHVLVGGDFNCVLDQRDIVGLVHPMGGGRMRGSVQLQALMSAHGLVDAWQSNRGPRPTEFTHVCQASKTAGRIDMWLCSGDTLRVFLQRCHHAHTGYPGDHAAVELQFGDPDLPQRAPRPWQLPLANLSDPTYLRMLRDRAAQAVELWQPATAAEAATPARSRWEHVKWELKEASILFELTARQRAAHLRRLATNPLHQAMREATSSPTPDAGLAVYVAHRTAARLVALERARTRYTAATALWQQFGEQSTSYFHRLGRVLAPDSPLITLRLPCGGTASLRESGGKVAMDRAILHFFGGDEGGLFARGETDLAAQDAALAALDRVVPENLLGSCIGPTPDGHVTLPCAKAALSQAANGKAPGSDGLPYEVYDVLWDLVGEAMVAAWNEAFDSEGDAFLLTETQRLGTVVLLHKGDGDPSVPLDDLQFYRPITLLNCDYKLLAKVMVGRLGASACAVVDETQSAFLPGRWIGDNVLFHLEEIDYCDAEAQPGCVLHLDFAKAYDRMDREWLFRSMEAMGFPAEAVRWSRLLLAGTQFRVRYHGGCTPTANAYSGMHQGNPLACIWYALGAQPLAALLRGLQSTGRIDGIAMPDGTLAPPSHQHADDTTVHTATVASAKVALEEGVGVFARASNARLNVSKTKGMILGSAVPFAGHNAYLGVSFPPPTEPIRHLGVLLSHDRRLAGDMMYKRRLRGVYAGITTWARFALTYLGRLHIVKQVLASQLWYHAGFVQPSPGMLQSICGAVDDYVAGARSLGGPPPARGRPGLLVESLPKGEGGLGRMDIRLQVTALQAKVALMLVHPCRRAWKVLMAAAFDRSYPGVGVRVLVSQRTPTAGGGLSARHLGYWRAMQALRPFRCEAPDVASRGHVLGEPLQFNGSVCRLNGMVWKTLPAALGTARRVSDLAGGMSEQIDAWVVAHLPASWQGAILQGPQLPPQWEVNGSRSLLRLAAQPADLFAVQLDGKLAPVQGAVSDLGEWTPAHVSFAPCFRGEQPLVLAAAVGGPRSTVVVPGVLQAYYLGTWQEGGLDPTTWGVAAGMPLTHYTVKAGRLRLQQLAAARDLPAEYVMGQGVRPRMWGPEGLLAWETRKQHEWQVQVFGPVRRPVAASAVTGRRRSRSPSLEPQPRLHPIERAARRLQFAGGAVGPQDGVDVGMRATDAPGPWCRAVRLVWNKRLSRELSYFGWQLLHRSLRAGAFRVGWTGDVVSVLDFCQCRADTCVVDLASLSDLGRCPATACLETYSHMFVFCPVVQPAVYWLIGLWGLVEAGNCPPLDPQVLVVGDTTAWQPAGQPAQLLWLHVRLTFLQVVWRLRCDRSNEGSQFTAAGIVARVVAALTRDIHMDWFRVRVDARQHAGVAPSWFSGRDTQLTEQRFVERWCVGAHLVTLRGDETDRSVVLSFPPFQAGPD